MNLKEIVKQNVMYAFTKKLSDSEILELAKKTAIEFGELNLTKEDFKDWKKSKADTIKNVEKVLAKKQTEIATGERHLTKECEARYDIASKVVNFFYEGEFVGSEKLSKDFIDDLMKEQAKDLDNKRIEAQKTMKVVSNS
jgi:hypothetical protein